MSDFSPVARIVDGAPGNGHLVVTRRAVLRHPHQIGLCYVATDLMEQGGFKMGVSEGAKERKEGEREQVI